MIFLGAIRCAVVIRRLIVLLPVAAGGYQPAAAPTNPRLAQLAGLDNVFARHPALTLIHIIPGLFFMVLGPIQFSRSIRARHLWWHRLSGRVFVVCGLVIGVSALVMSFAMPAIGGVNQAAAMTLFSILFLFAQGLLAHPSARNRFASGVDDSGVRDWIGCGDHSADRWNFLCDKSADGTYAS